MKTVSVIFFIILLHIQSIGQWNQLGFDIDGEANDDHSGTSISINGSGEIIAVGAPDNDGNGINSGQVRVYEWDGVSWIQMGNDIDGEAAGDEFGNAVSLSYDGNILVAGGYKGSALSTEMGYVRVYEWSGSDWIQKGSNINGEASNDWFGYSVSVDSSGGSFIAGAIQNSESSVWAGHAQIYKWDGTDWFQKGIDIDGEGAGDYCGKSVDISYDGNTVVIGSNLNNDAANGAGHIRIFYWDGSSWTQKGLDIDGLEIDEEFGYSVALDASGDIVAGSGPGYSGPGSIYGRVKVYEWDGTSWNQKGADIEGLTISDAIGQSVSLDSSGNVLAVGAKFANLSRVYEWGGSSWTQIGIDLNGESVGDASGTSIGLSSKGDRLAVGAPGNDASAGSDLGHVRVFEWEIVDVGKHEYSSETVAYPNPTNDYLNVSSELPILSITVRDIFGKEVVQNQVNELNFSIDLSKLKSGYYILELVLEDLTVVRKSIEVIH